MRQLYKYAWGNNPKRLEMKGRECILIASGKMGSVQIGFIDNGQREITSRRALRRIEGVNDAIQDAEIEGLVMKNTRGVLNLGRNSAVDSNWMWKARKPNGSYRF